MADPYKIMGLSPTASDEEVKQSYRKLAKKYHPDLNPGNQAAAEMMQQINAAYEQIKNEREGGGAGYSQRAGGNAAGGQGAGPGGPFNRSGPYGSGGHYGQGGANGQGSPFDDPEFYRQFSEMFRRAQQQHTGSSPRMQAVFHFINHGQYQEALSALTGIERDAEWFFASAIANAGAGNRMTALNHAQEAVRLAPNNEEYLSLLERFRQGIFTYRQTGQGYGFDMSNIGRTMLQLCALQMVCTCCCRLGPCI